MEASTTHTKSSILQKAVDSLKANGLSKIGSVVETKMPELMPELMPLSMPDSADEFSADLAAASFYSDSEDSDLVQSVKREKLTNSNSDLMDSISIQIFPESVSGLGISLQSNDLQSFEGTISADVETVTLSGMETVESDMSVRSIAQSPTAIDCRAAPAADSGFSIEASTKHCAKGKDLWAEGKCELALTEFRKALLGLESLLGTDHPLVSRLYHWMGKIFLQLIDDDDNDRRKGKQQKDSGAMRRAWADAAVESFSWCLKIRYTSRIAPVNDDNAGNNKDGATNTVSEEDLAVDAQIEESLGKAWKLQDDEWLPDQLKRNSSSRTKRSKGLDDLKESIKIERKADLALFRMEKNQLSSAIDVYASLANQYNKAIAAYSDDGAFSAMTKMAFWYHKLGRLKAKMDAAGNDDDEEISIDVRSKNSMPMDKTEHATHPNLRKNSGGKSKEYMEQSAFWYRMALEVFCTGIGRFDKTNEFHKTDDNINISAHPTYRQLISRLREVLSDHHRSDQGGKYLKSIGVWESVLHHFGAKEKMRQHRRLVRNKSDSLSRLKALREALRKAQDGFRVSSDIEETAWGADHQIVIRMQHDLHRADRLGDAVDLEIVAFPDRQAQRQQEQEEEEEEKQRQEQEEEENKNQLQQKKVQLQEEQLQEKRLEEEKVHRKGEELQEENLQQKQLQQLQQQKEDLQQQLHQQKKELEHQLHQQKKEREQQKQQQLESQQKKKQQSPSGSKGSIDRPSINGIETLRRLEDQIKLLEEKNAERDRLRVALEAKNDEIEEALAEAARNKEETIQWKQACENSRSRQEVLHGRIRQLENKVNQSEQKQGQLEFTRKKEGANLMQSATEKEVERLYWKQKFELAQTEWTECQTRLEDEVRNSRMNAGRKEAELMEWRGKYEGLDGEWKTRHGQIESLREENERLRREVTTGLAERKQLVHSKKLNDLEFVHSKEQQVREAMTEVAMSESEVVAWKRKFEVAEKEWLAIHNKSDVQAREAIADATRMTAELNRWKRKFEIAQREWLECQTRVEAHARGAIATAKRYETSHAEVTEKFTVAQKGLKSLIDQNKLLRKKVADSRSKQDQLEFSLKKQTIDFAKYQDILNRKTAEAQVWKDQCQASQQAQKQFSHEMQLSRVTDGNLQDRIADLRQQNIDLKERNKELQAEQERNKLELESKKVELSSVREAALKRIRQLKNEQKDKNSHGRQRKNGADTRDINTISTKPEKINGVLIEYNSNVDLSNPSSLAAKLGRTQRALEYVQRDHKESLEEIKTLTKAKKEMEGNVADAQEIISLLKTANNERIEHCTKLEKENEQIKQQVEESLDDSHQFKTQIELNKKLQNELKESIANKDALADQVKSLESRLGDSSSNKNVEELKDTISTLKSDLQKSIADKKHFADKVKALELRLEDSDSESDFEKNDELKEILSTLKSDLQKAIVEKKALAGQVKSLEFRLDSSDSESGSDNNDQELKNIIVILKSDLQKSNADKNALADKVKELEMQSHKWDSESESEKNDQELNKIISTLKSDLERSEARNEELLSEAKKQRLRSLSPSKTLVTGHSRYRSRRLDNSCHDNGETINPLADRCEELERELVISNHEIAALKDEVSQFSERRDSSAVSHNYHELQVLQELEQDLEESSQIREDLSSQLDAYKETIARAEEKEKELRRELNNSNQQIETLQDQFRKNKKQSHAIEGNQEGHQLTLVPDLERDLKESTETREKLSSQLKDSLKHTEEKQKEYRWLTNEYSQLEEKLETSLQIREDMSSQLNSLKKRLERAEEKEDEIDVLQDKLSDLEQKLEESSSQNKRLRSQIENLSSTGGSEDEQRQYLVDQISTLEKELGDSTKEIKSHKAEIAMLEKTSKNIANVEEEKKELMEKYDELEKRYESTKEQAEQNSKSLSKMLEVENKEQEHIRKECTKLKEDLQESSERNLELESRMEEMRKRNIESLSDRSINSCNQCLALGDELRSTIEQNDKHIQATQTFQDDHEKLLDRYNYLEKELNETIEQNERLESQLNAKENNPREEGLDNDDKYQELNIHCIELEEKLRDSNDINRKKDAQLGAMKRTVADLEAYADETASDLEQAMALKADGSGRGGEVMLLLERCNKLQLQLKESKKEIERLSSSLNKSRNENNQTKEEINESVDKAVDNKVENAGAGGGSDQAVEDLKEKLSSVTAANEQIVQDLNEKLKSVAATNERAVEELNEKLDKVTSAKEELETLLKKATEESEHQKRLKGHVEKDRDYLDKMYNECKIDMAEVKSDLDATKELMKKANEQKEELERQLQIEKHVSHSLKTSKEEDNSEDNELEELYRQARDELSEVESMLFETEEELEELKAKYEKLQQTSSKQAASGNSEDTESSEINHDLQDLSREELIVENKKALRKLQDTQTKLVDLQETNMILQAQLKSSLTFKEKSKSKSPNNNNGGGGFWGFGGGNNNNAEKETNDGNSNNDNDNNKKTNDDKNTNKIANSDGNKGGNNKGGGGFWSLGGGNVGKKINDGDTNKSADSNGEKDDASDGSGGGRFWGRRNGTRGGTSN